LSPSHRRKMTDTKRLFDALKAGAVKDEKKLRHAVDLLRNATELADHLSCMDEIRDRLDFLSDEMKDSGDPGMLMSAAIEKTGIALAATTAYFSEYFGEAFGIAEEGGGKAG